jgi:ferredoxin
MRIRLYRCCTERDMRQAYILSSKNTSPLNNKQALEEIISHVLNSSTGRDVFYSFSTDLNLVEEYYKCNHVGTCSQICYVDVDLLDVKSSIVSIYPIYIRDYIMNLIARTPEIINSSLVINPATARAHSILGILNTSQRSVVDGLTPCERSYYNVIIYS